MPFKVYTNWQGCSRWTNPNRNMATHIALETSSTPLCGKKYKNGTLDRQQLNLTKVTCKNCRKTYIIQNVYGKTTGSKYNKNNKLQH